MRHPHQVSLNWSTWLLLMAGLCGSASTPASGKGVIAAYTLVTPLSQSASGLTARAVLPAGATCPKLQVSRGQGVFVTKRLITMTQRVAPATTAPAFEAVTVCEANIPKNSTKAVVGDRTIPARLRRRIRNIAVFGDTGCRILGSSIQNCSLVGGWPLGYISQRIADRQPDVALFVGDFYYREAPCPANQQGECGSSPPPVGGLPFTDSAYGWMADAIMPMSPLFPVAPLVIVRGNHEACDRGGNGYFLFFDPFKDSSQECAPLVQNNKLVAPPPRLTPSWSTDLRLHARRTLRLALVDSAYGSDGHASSWAATQREGYEQADQLTMPQRNVESWLLVHRPILGHVTSQFAPVGDPLWVPWTSVDQQVASYGLLSHYNLILSSHLHLAQAVQIPGQPGQMILGNGGTLLDPPTGYETPRFGPLANAVGDPSVPGLAPYPAPTMDFTDVRFGYALVRPGRNLGEWSWRHFSPDDVLFAHCNQSGKSLACAAP
jgi:hypothetical protein